MEDSQTNIDNIKAFIIDETNAKDFIIHFKEGKDLRLYSEQAFDILQRLRPFYYNRTFGKNLQVYMP